jgi:4-amino-4-deoxy-L-arabinose transferase-like glycosyltransferase
VTRSKWLDPTSLQFAIALAILATIANGIWVFLDNGTPSWDQSHYLWATLQYKGQLAGGPIDVLDSIYTIDPDHGPQFTVLMLPFVEIFGASNRSGLLLNLLAAPVLFFSAGQIAWIIFKSWQARLLAIVLVATMPLVVGLSHTVLQDFLLVTLATVSLYLLLETRGFERRWVSLGLGLAMGLGTLTKVTFPMVMVGPLLVVLAQVALSRRGEGHEAGSAAPPLRDLLVNAGGALLVYLVVVGPWYLPNFDETLEYVRSTTSGPLSEGAGPADPLTFDALTTFTLGVVNFNVSWVLALVGLVAAGLNAGRIRAMLTRPVNVRRLLDLVFVLAWVSVPFLVVATAHNQDVRLMGTAMPGMAVLVAGAVTAVRWRWARVALATIAIVIPSYQVLSHTTEVDPAFLPGDISVTVGDYSAVLPLNNAPIGYEKLPEDDYGTPVIKYIEEVSADLPGGASATRSICILQSEAVINANTFNYLTAARQDPFLPMDVIGWENGERGLEEWLKGCDFALYTKQPAPVPGDESRLTLVNEGVAANHMTPKLFRIFRGPRRTFPTSEASAELEDEPGYLTLAGRPDQVKVLVREPIGG